MLNETFSVIFKHRDYVVMSSKLSFSLVYTTTNWICTPKSKLRCSLCSHLCNNSSHFTTFNVTTKRQRTYTEVHSTSQASRHQRSCSRFLEESYCDANGFFFSYDTTMLSFAPFDLLFRKIDGYRCSLLLSY